MQTATVATSMASVCIELPDPEVLVMPGVAWGSVDAFPSPAYWVYQVLAKRVLGEQVDYKLGRTLAEEVGACLLGGHGIPAKVGLAAFHHLKRLGVFSETIPSEAQLYNWLQQSLLVGDRRVHYRFAKQKSRYLAFALHKLQGQRPSDVGRDLRNWLLELPGIGYKTASWIARNWLRADDVAILDIHLLRAGQAIGLFPSELTVERHYVKLEELFIQFSQRIGVRPSELDAVVWLEMMSSPNSVRQMTSQSHGEAIRRHEQLSRPKQRQSDAVQASLFV